MNVLFLLRPLVGEKPAKVVSHLHIYITESMIKFLLLYFLKQSAEPLHIYIEYY